MNIERLVSWYHGIKVSKYLFARMGRVVNVRVDLLTRTKGKATSWGVHQGGGLLFLGVVALGKFCKKACYSFLLWPVTSSHSPLEEASWSKLCQTKGRDLYFLPGLKVRCGGWFPQAGIEGAKAEKGDVFPLGQLLLNASKDFINCFLVVVLGASVLLSEVFNKLHFVHSFTLAEQRGGVKREESQRKSIIWVHRQGRVSLWLLNFRCALLPA